MTSRWIGEYEIVRRLRVGGMATLYLAKRHGAAGFSRRVALKVIHPHLLDQPAFIEMFVDEARICSQISHPNVVHVEEFGEVDGTHYLIMEYLDGCSAGELLQLFRSERRTLDPELAASIIMNVAAGLHAAHETRDNDGQPLDIVHRDISPSNILLSADGHTKLIDFGIAKARNRLSETEAGVTLKGKYKYVAPEQATRAQIDRRSDLFSLGVVFWELLVGEPLFPDDTHVGLFNRLSETNVTAPSIANPAVPATLDPIVLAMLQHDPARRPQTAADIQRWIANVMPAAANRASEDLGSLIADVRDKRRAARAGTEEYVSSEVSFSPIPRSRTMSSAPEDYRIEIEPAQAANTQPPPIHPAAPARNRRLLQLGVLALVGFGLVVGVVVGRQNGAEVAAPVDPETKVTLPSTTEPATTQPATAQPANSDQTVERSAKLQQAGQGGDTTAKVETPAAGKVEDAGAAKDPGNTAATDPGGEQPAADPIPEQTSRPNRNPVARVSTPVKRPTNQPVRRVQQRDVREPPVEVAQPKVVPRNQTIRSGKSTFVDTSFDDAGNTDSATTAPTRAKVKKTPIVTNFEN